MSIGLDSGLVSGAVDGTVDREEVTAVAPVFQHGDLVVRRNRRDERGTVQGQPLLRAGRYFYKVVFPSSSNPVQVSEGDLEKVTFETSIEDQLLNGEFGDHTTLSRLVTFERLRRPLQDTLYSFRATRTEFQPYQFKPLLKFLQSTKQRLLLADEVGLGKTIEAGFILCEMLARYPHTFRRALVVCKASLCIKWQMEMRRRFDLQFEIWKAPQLRDFLRRYREEEDLELRAICSLESFRNPTVRQEWEATPPPLDVLVIDEAHHLKNARSDSHKACREAAASADAVLALTATPIQIGSRDLFNLLSLLDQEEFASFPYFEACMLFNRHIVAAQQKIAQTDPDRFQVVHRILNALGEEAGYLQREALSEAKIQSSPAELVVAWTAVSDSLRRHPLYHETLRMLAESDPASRRATVEIQRNLAEMNLLSRVFSRTRRRDVHIGTERVAVVKKVDLTDAERGFYDAVLDFVRETYLLEGKDTALLFGLMMPQRQLASCIPAMVEYYESEIGPPGGLDSEESDADAEDWNTAAATNPESRRQHLRQLIQSWYQTGQPDSKFKVLQRCLEELQETQPGEPIVIFSYFRKTLEYLTRRLGALGYSNTVISGAFPPPEREKRIAQFREGKYQILLSTEVGSEGLDFQFCHVLFNYDLPWNPMVIEQRIGRLDRFGQKAEKILIFNLSAPGTIEDEILNRLYRRINLFESYIGDLEAILGNEITDLTKELFDPDMSEEQRKERIDQAGLLLEKRKLQFEEWERSSPQFIGHDEYYKEEVDRAQALGRYIGPEDLARFVIDFLAHFDRRCELIEDGPSIYRLEASEKLLQFVIAQPEDNQKAEFCRRLHQKSLPVTFDSEAAEKDKSITFLHVRHFFIRAIVEAYRQGDISFHPVARVQVSARDGLPAGDYLYMLARATIRAAREQDALLPVVVNLQTLEALDEDSGELCIGRMVREGTDLPQPLFNADVLDRAYSVAESILVERFEVRRANVERVNQAFVDARMASVRESYRLKISRKQTLLDNARNRNQPPSYIRMLEGTVRNLTAELQNRESEIERLRSVTAEHAPVAAGFLRAS
jgi:superfamily II DNA or RNA helicase